MMGHVISHSHQEEDGGYRKDLKRDLAEKK